MRRISWISSTVLAAPGASFTGGVLSVIIRPKQLEDYTVTHTVETDAWRRALLPVRRAQLSRLFRLRRKLTPYHTASSSPFQHERGAMPSKKSAPGKKAQEASTAWRDRLHYFEARLQEMVEAARELVEIESPSDNKPAGDRLGAFLAEKFRVMGGETRMHRTEIYADHLQVNFPGRGNGAPVLLLGHFDTVYPLGTLATMLCGVAGDRLHGPGVLDMKAGIVLMMEAIAALKPWQGDLPPPAPVFRVRMG